MEVSFTRIRRRHIPTPLPDGTCPWPNRRVILGLSEPSYRARAVENQCDAKVNVSYDHRLVAVARSLERDIGAELVLVTASQPCFVVNVRTAEAFDGEKLRDQ
jgi:hypothetical protein